HAKRLPIGLVQVSIRLRAEYVLLSHAKTAAIAIGTRPTVMRPLPCPSRSPPIAIPAHRDSCQTQPAPPDDIYRTTIVHGLRPQTGTRPGRRNIATKRNIIAPNSRPDHRA